MTYSERQVDVALNLLVEASQKDDEDDYGENQTGRGDENVDVQTAMIPAARDLYDDQTQQCNYLIRREKLVVGIVLRNRVNKLTNWQMRTRPNLVLINSVLKKVSSVVYVTSVIVVAIVLLWSLLMMMAHNEEAIYLFSVCSPIKVLCLTVLSTSFSPQVLLFLIRQSCRLAGKQCRVAVNFCLPCCPAE